MLIKWLNMVRNINEDMNYPKIMEDSIDNFLGSAEESIGFWDSNADALGFIIAFLVFVVCFLFAGAFILLMIKRLLNMIKK